MRYGSRADRQTIETVVGKLTAIADTGTETVPVLSVLRWLGVQVSEPAGPARPRPEPGADPVTGCRPVVARE